MSKEISRRINKLVKVVTEEKTEVILTDEQKKLLISTWRAAPRDNPPSLKELTNIIFPDKDLDGRSLEGKAVQSFLATFGAVPPKNVHKLIGPYGLTVAEKEFIDNNCVALTPFQIAIHLWGKEQSPLSKEFKALKKYLNNMEVKPTLNFDMKELSEDVSNIFTPPKNYTECLRLVNKYNHDILSTTEITEQQKQGVHTLIRYLHSPRFLKTISTFREEENRVLFLSEFIRTTYDKSDLSVDELNLYISLAASYPLEYSILAERESLSQKLKEETENGRIFQPTVEAINAKNKEYEECQERQAKLIKELNGSRSKRLEKTLAANTSILPLIRYWQEEKNRKNFIALAKIKEQARIKVTEQLLSVESVIAEIYGAVEEW